MYDTISHIFSESLRLLGVLLGRFQQSIAAQFAQ